MNGTSPHEYDYGYLNDKPNLVCPSNVTSRNYGTKVAEAKTDENCSEDKLKILISTYGAVVVSIYASDRAFMSYRSGVFDGCSNAGWTNHAVTAVGYGTENGIDYWLIKNSWGPYWGASGYIKIKRGVGMCGIGKNCYTAVCVKSDGPVSPIAQPPALEFCDIKSPTLSGNYVFWINGKKNNY